jgi:hypothetical protein
MAPEVPGVVAWIAPGPDADPDPPGLTEVPDAREGLWETTTLVIVWLFEKFWQPDLRSSENYFQSFSLITVELIHSIVVSFSTESVN